MPPQLISISPSQNYSIQQNISSQRISPSTKVELGANSNLNKIPTNISCYNPIQFNEAKLLSEFRKDYSNEGKYGVDLYDIFDSKFQDFIRMCKSCAFPKNFIKVSFRELLKDKAKENWRDFPENKDMTYIHLADTVRSKFKTRQRVQEFNIKWRSITFSKVIQENQIKGISSIECEKLLFNTLEKLYKSIATSLHVAVATEADFCFREQVITACLRDKDCLFVL